MPSSPPSATGCTDQPPRAHAPFRRWRQDSPTRAGSRCPRIVARNRRGPALVTGRRLQQDRGERADPAEPAPVVQAAGRGVVVVDVEADTGRDPAQCVAYDGGHGGGAEAATPPVRR